RLALGALAFRRSTAVLAWHRGAKGSIQAALHAMSGEGVTCALAPRLSDAPRAPVVVPAGPMPGSPGSGLRDRPQAPHPPRISDRIRNAPFDGWVAESGTHLSAL